MSGYYQSSQSQNRSGNETIEPSQVHSDNLAYRLGERLRLHEPFSRDSSSMMSRENISSGRFSIGAKMVQKSYCFETPPSQLSSQYSSASQQQYNNSKPLVGFQPFESSGSQQSTSSRQMGDFEKIEVMKQQILDETMKDGSDWKK